MPHDDAGRQPQRPRLSSPITALLAPGWVIAGQLGPEIGSAQAEQANHYGKQRLRKPILRNAAHELRTDAVADGEQEHQKEERLERRRNRDAELADDYRGNQRRGYRSKTETLVGEGPEIISGGQSQKDGDFRIGSKRMDKPIDHDVNP